MLKSQKFTKCHGNGITKKGWKQFCTIIIRSSLPSLSSSHRHIPSFLFVCLETGPKASECVQSAHWAGPLPALIIRLLWPSVHLHSWFRFSFQESFVKQRSRKWGCFAAVVQAWRMCLRGPHWSRHGDHPGPLPDGEHGVHCWGVMAEIGFIVCL